MSDKRVITLAAFGELTGLTGIDRLVQRGRDPITARFTLEFTDGRSVRVGTIETLRSQTKLESVLMVAIDRGIAPVKAADWRSAIGALILHCKDVEETVGESFEETVREWLVAYTMRATKDRAGAVPTGSPFTEDGDLYISVAKFRVFIEREYGHPVKMHELWAALGDLGLGRETLNYLKPGGKRSSASYYRGSLTIVEGNEDQ